MENVVVVESRERKRQLIVNATPESPRRRMFLPLKLLTIILSPIVVRTAIWSPDTACIDNNSYTGIFVTTAFRPHHQQQQLHYHKKKQQPQQQHYYYPSSSSPPLLIPSVGQLRYDDASYIFHMTVRSGTTSTVTPDTTTIDTDFMTPAATETSSTTTAAVAAASCNYLQDFMLERNVTIKSVNWCSPRPTSSSSSSLNVTTHRRHNEDSSMLLQVCKGASVPPVDGTRGTIIKRQLERLLQLLQSNGCDVNVTMALQETSLDQHCFSLTTIDRLHQFRHNQTTTSSSSYNSMALSMKLYAELRSTQWSITDMIRSGSSSNSSNNDQQQQQQQFIHILYLDEHICVINKPSGVLSVPGPRRNPSICEALYYLVLRNTAHDNYNNNSTATMMNETNGDCDNHCSSGNSSDDNSASALLLLEQQQHQRNMDQMVVHRLDMDTSGIMVFALSKPALHQLHSDFRQRAVTKVYQALVCNHIVGAPSSSQNNLNTTNNSYHTMNIMNNEFEINVDLERDPEHPPFMRIAQTRQQQEQQSTKRSKFLDVESKPCCTEMQILSYEYITTTTTANTTTDSNNSNTTHTTGRNSTTTTTKRLPVTRVQLIPRTGRTHQLRVHMAQVLHHPIVGDDIYGYGGDCYNVGDKQQLQQQPATVNDNSSDVPMLHEHERQLADLNLSLCLHAHKLYLRHPISGAPMIFECAPYF